jgi:hypothetical protein
MSISEILKHARDTSSNSLSGIFEDKLYELQNKHVIEASNLSKEEVIVDFEERTISSSKKGFVLRELQFAPLYVDTDGYVKIPLPAGMLQHIKLCSFECPSSQISVLDLPENSFSEARYAFDLEKNHYGNTETVKWTAATLEPGVTFSYVPPPYQHARTLLNPFLGLASFSQWLIGLLAFIIPIIGAYMIGPVVADEAKKSGKRIIGITCDAWRKLRVKSKPSKHKRRRT